MKRILLLGGTSESRWISRMLIERDLQVIGSVTTSSARQLFDKEVQDVMVGKFTSESLQDFLRDQRIEMVLDATHPFAAQISKNAIEVCDACHVQYIRYERPSLRDHLPHDRFTWVASLEAAALALSREAGNILVATGAKNLAPFLNDVLRNRTFFRLLPTELGRSRATEHGLGERVWWDNPNPDKESVRSFLQVKAIQAAVVKDSGPQGISLMLMELCPPMGIRLFVLERPYLNYPLVCSSAQELQSSLNLQQTCANP